MSDGERGVRVHCATHARAFRGESARTPGPQEGAGLGLSIARGIVEAHSGQIAVRNAGPGCQFLIRLPLARPGVPAINRTVPRRRAPVAGSDQDASAITAR
jgi:light-regulated signal transduction histidine kinase (bacteriophytochrome)